MSMPLQIMKKDFTLLGQISEYASLQIESEWSGIGKIELVINRYLPNAHLLVADNIIFPHGRLDLAFIIRHRGIQLDEAGKITENWAIRADSLKVWFADKLTTPPVGLSHDSINDDAAETIMHHYVNSTVINPLDPGNKLDGLVLGTNQKRGEKVDWQSRYKDLSEELAKISMLSGIGWNIVVDRKNEKYVFETYEGLDLTEHNGVNPPAIFSPEFQTIKNLEYAESQLDYKNYAIVAGQGEGADRRIVEVGDPSITGFDRRVLFVDARDIEEETEGGTPIPVEEIERKLRDRGLQKLAEHAQEFYLEGQSLGGVVRKRDTSISGVVDDVALDRVDLSGSGRNFIRSTGSTFINHLVTEISGRGEKVNESTFKIYANPPNGTCVLFNPVPVTLGEDYTLNADMSDTISSVVGVVLYDANGVILEEPDLLSGAFNWVPTYKSYQYHSDTTLLPPYTFRIMSNKVKTIRVRLGIYRGNLINRDVLIKEPKLELGSTASPWSPAPEDSITTWYNSDKTVHLDPIDLSKISTYSDSLFTWDSSTPTGTSAIVEYSLDNQTWSPLTSGDSLPFTRNQPIRGMLYIRQRLLTSNQQVTPSITNFRYTINGYKLPPNAQLGRLNYGIDYNLGDMTTLQSKDWGVTLDARITAVKEIYEHSKQAIELIFGNKQPTLTSKIKQELAGLQGVLTR